MTDDSCTIWFEKIITSLADEDWEFEQYARKLYRNDRYELKQDVTTGKHKYVSCKYRKSFLSL
jgi:hypothetical protein